MNVALMLPRVGILDETGTHGVVSNIGPTFPNRGFGRAQDVIEEFRLPDGRGEAEFSSYPFARPFLPVTDKRAQGTSFAMRRAEEVHVIGHDDVAPNLPAVPVNSAAPFIDENCDDFGTIKDTETIGRTRRDEVDWVFDPDPIEAPKMAVFVSRHGFGLWL
jgi:hypothetical protein